MSNIARLVAAIFTGSGASLPQSGSIVFNLKADSLALSDGATVTSWTDSVGSLAFSNSGTPIFKTNQLNSKPCVRFTGGRMVAAGSGTSSTIRTTILSGTHTTMIIAKLNAANGLGCMWGANAGGDSYFFVADGAVATSTVGRYNNGTGFSAPNVNGANLFASCHTSANSLPYTFSGTGLERIHLNGTCVASNVSAFNAVGADFAVGDIASGALPANVDIFDIVVWNVTLTRAEIFQATQFYMNKYAQTLPWAAVSAIRILDGDSLTAGVGSGSVAGSYPYQTAQSLGLAYGQWTNEGVGGIRIDGMSTKLPEWSSLGSITGKNMRVAAFEYYNMRGDSAATIEANTNTYITQVRALSSTKLALGTSTSSSSDPDATRVAVCAYYDANSALADAYMPFHNNTSIGNQTAYTNNSGTLWSDTVHLNAAGYTILAGLVTTGLTAIP